MASRLKIVEPAAADLAPPPQIDFTPAPTRKRIAGWTAERQRRFIDHLSVSGHVGEACALVSLSSTSFYRLCNRPGADSFVAACNAARALKPTCSGRAGLASICACIVPEVWA